MAGSNKSCPVHVAWLGYGGLLPFLGLALLILVDRSHAPIWSGALIGYGAVILSFVGALHWGFAMTLPALTPALRRWAFVWSVVPALIGWVATVLAPGPASALLIVGFALHLWQDIRLAAAAQLPAWYLPLRWRLTLVACGCLAVNGWVGAGAG